jgi:asparagine synthase (glutamine-hydrolysing)
MCGICGIIQFDGQPPVDVDQLTKMNDVLAHRGPDDKGIFVSDQVGLAMTRLSIIDLTTGHQPIFNERQDICIVFNGEIYNYKELKSSLEVRGHRFTTSSDTEVVVHLYEDLSYECLSRLDGMFAFAIWDARTKTLFLARDRLGEKPFVYYLDNSRLVFASEIKSILECKEIDRTMDLEALDQYFTFLSIPAPFTIFRAIRKLLPGHYLVCDGAGNISVKQYWDLIENDECLSESEESLIVQISSLLKQSVQERLIADVPLGAFLSGGLDSSLIVAMMSRLSSEPVKTFSIGFVGPDYYNELGFSRLVACRFNTDHHELIVTPDIINVLPKLVWHWDEPFAVSSAVPTYYLSQLAREHVKVVLTGDGADEVFAGYPRYLWDKAADYVRRYTPQMGRKLGLALLNQVGAVTPLSARDFFRRLSKFMESTLLDNDGRYVFYLSLLHHRTKCRIYSADLMDALSKSGSTLENLLASYYSQYRGKDQLNRRLYADIKMSLADEMLTKVDKMTMAVGLEARPPFLDFQFVENMARVSGRYKLKHSSSKYILKKLAKSFLPPEIVHRKKHGFEVPIDFWIRTELKDLIHDYLSHDRIKRLGLLDSSAVQNLIKAHDGFQSNWGHQLWALLIFQMWCEVFLEKKQR